MSCLNVHDFVTGTTIALARTTIAQSAEVEAWDILRPNRKAAGLVAQHVAALNAFDISRNPKVSV